MKLVLAGKLHYHPGKKGHAVYYHFTDQFGCRQRVALKLTVSDPGKNKRGEWIFPEEAYAIASSIDQQVRERRWKLPTAAKENPILLQEAFDKFLVLRKPNLADKTIELHELSFSKLIGYFGNIPVESITSEKMIRFRDAMIRQDKLTNAAWWLRHLSAFFNFCADSDVGIIIRSPLTKKIKLKQPEKPIVIFGDDELGGIYDFIETNYGKDALLQVRFLELTGWRVSDGIDLKRTRLDFSRHVIQQRIKKTGAFRDYPMDRYLERFLMELPTYKDDYCFKFRSVHTLDHFFLKAIEAVIPHRKGEVSLHTLRKQFTYNCYRNGVPVEDCSRLLGHQSIITTMKYYHYWDSEKLRDSLHQSRKRLAKKWQKFSRPNVIPLGRKKTQ
jgi:integrase